VGALLAHRRDHDRDEARETVAAGGRGGRDHRDGEHVDFSAVDGRPRGGPRAQPAVVGLLVHGADKDPPNILLFRLKRVARLVASNRILPTEESR
jgi:hypothetical protein